MTRLTQLIPHRARPISDLDNKHSHEPIIPTAGLCLLILSVLLFVYATCGGGGDTWY